MPEEIEAKFLNADHDALRVRLRELSAACTHPNHLTKRLNFDYPDMRLKAKHGWVRLRDEGERVTLTYKQLNDRSIAGMQEVELIVKDFTNTEAFLKAIGLEVISYQETKRESWELGNVEIDLDEWPWVPPFVEVEGPSKVEVWDVVEKLGLPKKAANFGSVEIAYQAVYDVTEDEVNGWEQIAFTDIPDWLEKRKK